MDSVSSTASDIDDERQDASPRQNFQIEIQVPTFSSDINGFNHGGVEDASNQLAASSSVLVENNGKVISHGTDSRRCNDQYSAQPKVPRMLKELDNDDGLRFAHPAVPRMQWRQEIDGVVAPSPSTRGSKRRAEETQLPLVEKRSRAARNTEDDNDDADYWGNRDHDFSKNELEKNDARVKRNSTTSRKPIYDMDFHPMDRITRPNMAATRKVLAKETEDVEVSDNNDRSQNASSNARINTEYRRSQRSTRGKHSRNLQFSNAPATKRVAKDPASRSAVVRKNINSSTPGNGNLLDSFIGTDFDNLCSMDRIFHNIQHGAPIDSVSLPHSWARVSDILINEGFFTKAQYNAWGGVTVLKRRYDAVRCVVQGEHAESEKKDILDQALYWAEGMDVLDLVGSRTIYKHKGIPDYMKGVDEFSQHILDQKRVDFFGSADEAASVVVPSSESSRYTSTVTDLVVPDTQMTTDVLLDGERVPILQMELETESEVTPLYSEDPSVVVEEHRDQEATVKTYLGATASPASPLAHDGLSPVPRMIAPVEHGELGAPSNTTTIAFLRSPQTLKMEGKSNRRSKRSKSSTGGFTIHEDSSSSISRATVEFQGGILDQEDSKENVTDEDDDVEPAELTGIDDVSDSATAASGRNSSGYRAISANRGGEIADAPPRLVNDLDPDLPPKNLSQTETSQQGVQSTRNPRTSSTLTSSTVA
ncbi:hypothetical protein MMC27_004972 [Xylographa pallens]|nr:hypothetical protein [Xylographa pallens]